ncbi:phage upper tail fiber protein [Rhodococcus ruber]|uniref:phage upper tail fiber protein n=1 Tax=Rhodococcus ruber TaxID=1830 RepID=UPI001E4D8E7C|nr:hypothetical protein [Rhodococcus ruber]MCD2127625.1 hypothetical protein [Rhodococcus ruber]MCZ4505951.1 hypothetical protein [Rhodococcus ruber]MCZ4533530.1 hypothetical protein [Rhodococcus ruber]
MWKNDPDVSTPISAESLNHIEEGLESAHNTLEGRLSDAALNGTYVRTVNDIAPDSDGNVTVTGSGSGTVSDATTSTKGVVQLAGDLAGTASAPTVPGLAGKANASHTHAQSDVTGLSTTLAGKADLVGGTIPQAQIPAVAVTEFLGAVASQVEMLALSGQRGDWCTRTDLGTDWQLIAEPSSTFANWRERTYPASPVSSVAGRTGAVTLSTADITDMTTVGSNVAKATDAAAARAAIGAGTSNLAIGTTGTTAAAGNDSRLSDQRTPTDLSVTNAKVASNAAIALSKLATGYVQGSSNGTPTTLTVWVGTEAQYTAIGTKDPATIYFRTA